jgi:hypothetical protein
MRKGGAARGEAEQRASERKTESGRERA